MFNYQNDTKSKDLKRLFSYSDEKVFSRLINNKCSDNYWNYIYILRKRKSKEIFEKSILLTVSESAKERIIGIDVLGQFGHPRLHQKVILKKYFHLLKKETDQDALSSVLFGIGHNNESLTTEQLDVICSFRNHKSSAVRVGVAWALGSKDEPNAIQTLIALSKDKNPQVRDSATFRLACQTALDTEDLRAAL